MGHRKARSFESIDEGGVMKDTPRKATAAHSPVRDPGGIKNIDSMFLSCLVRFILSPIPTYFTILECVDNLDLVFLIEKFCGEEVHGAGPRKILRDGKIICDQIQKVGAPSPIIIFAGGIGISGRSARTVIFRIVEADSRGVSDPDAGKVKVGDGLRVHYLEV